MSGTVHRRDSGAIAILTIDNPPVAALSQPVRAALDAHRAAIEADPAIRGVVVRAEGRTFVAGADISEFGKPQAPPVLRDLFAAIEGASKPWLALLHGTPLGGGLELAMACHYRLADPATVTGLPEIGLGVIPGAGGTQRLPRLVGQAAALDIIVGGRRPAAEEALRLGLIDGLAPGGLDDALAFLSVRLDDPPPRTSARPPATPNEAALSQARTDAARRLPGQIAPTRAIDMVALSSGPADAGLAAEAACFLSLRDGPQAAALRHLFFAERAVTRIPEAEGHQPAAVDRLAVVGGGTMGAGIAAAALLAGLPVVLLERDDASAGAGRDRIAGILGDAVRRGKLAGSARDDLLSGALRTTADAADLAGCDLAIEAAFEDMAVKTALLGQLAAVMRADAVLATNTSYLDVGRLAAATASPGRVIGLHFFSPAHVMKLVELVVPATASGAAVATGAALARRLGKTVVRCGVCEGFIGNRILSAYRKAMEYTVEDGASPYQVDAAMRAFGWPMGLFEMGDLAGLDIAHATRRRLDATRDPRERTVAFADRLVEAGRLGRKTGAGYYRYVDGRAEADAAVEAIIAQTRAARGIEARDFTEAEILRRLNAAIANEIARILEEGIAARPGDVDVVMTLGYGYPRWRGGPAHHARTSGLAAIAADLSALASEDAFFWTPAQALLRAAAAGHWPCAD